MKKIFWKGIQAFVPIMVTIAIVVWVFRNIETFFGYFLQKFISPEYYFDGLGTIVGLVFVFMLGILLNAWIIKKVYKVADNIVHKIPFIKSIYSAVKDMLAFFDKTADSMDGKAVVVNTPLGRVLGMITCESFEHLPAALGGAQDVLVYIPLSYQIGGFMLAVPKAQVTPIDMSVNTMMSTVITAGMTGQQSKKSVKV
jgi:uncharacterized membrane protein